MSEESQLRPQFAFRTYEYRLFCRECSYLCDVRAISEENAEAEARKVGWSVTNMGATCPLCIDLNKKERVRQQNLQAKEQYL